MATILSDSYATGLTNGQFLTGRTPDNGNGGSLTPVYSIISGGGQSMQGNGAGGVIAANALAASLLDVPDARCISIALDRAGATSNVVLYGCHDGAAAGRKIGLLLVGATSLRLVSWNASDARTDHVTVSTGTSPEAGCRLELDWKDPAAVVARIRNADGSVRNTTTSVNLSPLPVGTKVGFGFFQGGQTGIFDNLAVEDGPTFPKPVLTSPTGSATGPSAATGSVSTDVANGTLFWLDATSTPTEAAMLASANSKTVTAAGAQTGLTSTGLTPSTPSYRRYYMQRRAEGVNSDIAQSATFNTPAPSTPPAGTSATNVLGADVVITFSSTGGTVDSATASLPVGSPANGAVAQGPAAMVFGASGFPGVWSARFTNVPPGDYGVPVVLASNVDNPSVSITGAVAFYIDDATGTSTPATDGTAPTLTSPTLTSDAPGFITAGASTNEATGTAYAVVTNSTTKPTAAQVKAGQGSGGTAAPWSGSVLVTAAGTFSIRKAHTLGIGSWYAHIIHEDGAGNQSAVATSAAFAINDGTKPVMQGVVSLSALTETSYTTGCDAATDNVGVVGYQVSLDGGANWIEKNTSRTHNATGRTPGSTDAVWWRAYDAVPNYADPITRSVTLAAVPAPVITTQPANASVVEGSGTTLTAAATVSTGTLSWQWFSRPAGNTGAGTAVSGATSANLATGNLSLAQDGIQYLARARNTIGGVTEDTFTDWATVTVQSAVLYGFDFDTAPGLVFGDLAGALTALSRQSGVGIRVYAYSTVDGALVAQSSALTTNSAGRLARWESAGIQASTDYRLLFVRQSDGEVCATRMTATA